MKNHHFLFLFVAFLITSCSVEKRVYNKGYHMSNNQTVKVRTEKPLKSNEATLKLSPVKFFSNQTIEKYSNIDQSLANQNEKATVNNVLKPFTVLENCDSIFMKDGSVRFVKLVTITDSTLQVTDCKNTAISEVINLGLVSKVVTNKGERYSFVPYLFKNNKTTYYEVKQDYNKQEKKLKAMSFASFGLAIGALIITAFMFFAIGAWPILIGLIAIGLVALILGAYSFIKMKNNPNLRKQKIYSILGMAFGALLVVFAAVLLVAVLLKWI